MVHASKENKILKWLVKHDSSLLLMHHRFPTSTINVKRAAHPFSTKQYFGKNQYILVHNGGIRNSHDLFEKHQELGINYHSFLQDNTFNDSEALLWDFALFMEGRQDELKAAGGIAFICLKLVNGKLEKMYFGRNTNPLNMLRNKAGLSLSSEGEGEAIDANVLHTWNYKLKRLTKKELTIPGYLFTPAKNYSGNYSRDYSRDYSGTYSGDYQSPAKRTPTYNHSEFDMYGDPKCEECVDWGYACSYHWGYSSAAVTARKEVAERNSGFKSDTDREANDMRNILAKQFGHIFSQPVIPRSKAQQEFEHDPETQMLLPVGSTDKSEGKLLVNGQAQPTVIKTLAEHLNYEEQRRASEDALIFKTNPITEEEIDQEYLAYLASVKGQFESAYWSIEADYDYAMTLPNTKEAIRTRRLIELVMERIDNDPEYINETSVSDVWSKTWKKK